MDISPDASMIDVSDIDNMNFVVHTPTGTVSSNNIDGSLVDLNILRKGHPTNPLIAYLNINSLRGTKFNLLHDILTNIPMDIICIDETKLTCDFPNSQFYMEGLLLLLLLLYNGSEAPAFDAAQSRDVVLERRIGWLGLRFAQERAPGKRYRFCRVLGEAPELVVIFAEKLSSFCQCAGAFQHPMFQCMRCIIAQWTHWVCVPVDFIFERSKERCFARSNFGEQCLISSAVDLHLSVLCNLCVYQPRPWVFRWKVFAEVVDTAARAGVMDGRVRAFQL